MPKRRQPTHSPFAMSANGAFHDEMLERAGRRCEWCGAPSPLTLSRLIAGSRRGPYEWWNVRVLCGSGSTGCHGWAEDHPVLAEAAGFRVPGSLLRGVYIGAADVVHPTLRVPMWTVVELAKAGRI